MATLASMVAKLGIDTSEYDRGIGQAESRAQGAGSRIGSFLGGAFQVSAGLGIFQSVASGIGSIKDAMIGGNAQFEDYQVQFEALFKSADRASEQISNLSKFAATTPFELPEVVEASKSLQVFGGDALNTMDNLKFVGNAAAVSGQGFNEVAFWVGRAYSAIQAGQPFGEATMRLQEMGLMGADSVSKLQELQKIKAPPESLWETFRSGVQSPADAMDKLSQTWTGLMSTLSDTLAGLGRTIGAPLFEMGKNALGPFLEWMSTTGQATAESFGQSLAGAVSSFAAFMTDTVIPAALVFMDVWGDAVDGFGEAGLAGAIGNIAARIGELVPSLQPFMSTIDTLMMALSQGGFEGLLTSLREMFPIISPLITAFQLVRDGVLTFIAALSGDWAPSDQVLGFHQIIGNLGIFIVETLVPAFMNLLSWIGQNQSMIAQVGTVIGVAIIAFTTISSIVTTVIGVVGGLLAGWAALSATFAASSSIIGFIVAILGGPVTVVIALVIAAIAGLYLAWTTNFLGIRDIAQSVWAFIISAMAPVAAELGRFSGVVVPLMTAAWQNISNITTTVWSAISSVIGTVLGAIVGFVTSNMSTIQAVVNTVLGAVQAYVQLVWTIISNTIIAGLAILSGDWSTAWTAMQTIASTIWTTIQSIVQLGIDTIAGIVRGLAGTLSGMAGAFAASALALGASIINGIINGLGDIASMIKNKITSGISGGIEGVKSFFGISSPAKHPSVIEIGDGLAQGMMGSWIAGLDEGKREVLKEVVGLISSISSAVKGGVDALEALQGYDVEALSDTVLKGFAANLESVIKTIASISVKFKTRTMKHAAEIADSLSKVIGVVGGAVQGLTALQEYDVDTLYEDILYGFSENLEAVIEVFLKLAEKFNIDGVEAAARLAEGIGKIVGVVGSSVDALVKLANYEPVRILGSELQVLFDNMARVVIQFEELTEDWILDVVQYAAEMAESVGVIVNLVGGAVDSFIKLADFSGIPEESIQELFMGISEAVELMVKISRGFIPELIEYAAEFADNVGRIIAPIGEAIDSFIKLEDYEGVAPEKVEILAADIHRVVWWMGQIAGGITESALEAANEFMTKIGVVIDTVASVVDMVISLEDYEGVQPEVFEMLAADVDGIFRWSEVMVGLYHDVAEMSVQWLKDVKKFAENYEKAVEAIESLPEFPDYPDMPSPPDGGSLGGAALGVRNALGPTIVGEKGPEIAWAGPGGLNVLSTSQSRNMLGDKSIQQHNHFYNVNNDQMAERAANRANEKLAQSSTKRRRFL